MFPGARRAAPESSLHARLGDLAALVLAVLVGHLHPALALASVLAGTGVGGAVAAALALARVHALAVNLGRIGRVREEGRRGAEDPGGHGGDECSLGAHCHSPMWWWCFGGCA